MKRTGQAHAGFTLMEMMVGVTVFSIGILGSLGLLSGVIRADAFTTRLMTAGNFGYTQLESLAELGFDGVSSGSDTQGMYELTWTVSPHGNNVKKIYLTVEWDNADGIHKTMNYKTMVMNEAPKPLLPAFALPGAGGHGIPPPGSTTSGGTTTDGSNGY